jgi:hypothetical protein
VAAILFVLPALGVIQPWVVVVVWHYVIWLVFVVLDISTLPCHLCWVVTWLLVPIIHPVSSGSQGWGQVLGHRSIIVLWLVIYATLLSSPLPVIVAWHDDVTVRIHKPPCKQWLAAVRWVQPAGCVLVGCCLVVVECRKSAEKKDYCVKKRNTWGPGGNAL